MTEEMWLLCAAVIGFFALLIWFFAMGRKCPSCRYTESEIIKTERLGSQHVDDSEAPAPDTKRTKVEEYEVYCRCTRCGCEWSYTEKRKQLR